jgi:hypothetical protein
MFVFAIPTFAGKNPADYLLQIQIIETHWQRHNRDFDGWGRGVIKDGQTVRGFDFTYSSNQHFMRTIGNVHYPGKWKKSPLKLEILVGEIGSVDKYRTYQLKTSVRDDVYVQGPNGAKAVSQDEYKARSIR